MTTDASQYISSTLAQTWDLSNILHDTYSGRKFYTLKVHALRLFLLTIKQCKFINVRNLGPFLFNYTKCVKIQQLRSKITLGVYKFCSSTQIMQEKMLFSWKIYTAGTNFTRPPVVTVATNLNSGWAQVSELQKIKSCWPTKLSQMKHTVFFENLFSFVTKV